MCLEGGCGVCIVNIVKRNPVTRNKVKIAVNSCLWLVYACHGMSIKTIEGIGNRKDGYHSVQNALYHFNGTQCGYCSPGMIMNMYSLLETNNGRITKDEIENAFGGNICRCTGYRPILDAFKTFAIDEIDIENANSTCCTFRPSKNEFRSHLSIETEMPETNDLLTLQSNDLVWHRPLKIENLLNILNGMKNDESYILIGGNTGHGNLHETTKITIKTIFSLSNT